MTTTAFKNPKIPDRIKIEQQEKATNNALNLLKKPPVPKPQTSTYTAFEEKPPKSFLHGNQKRQNPRKSQSQDKKNNLPDHLKTLKSGLPRRSDVMKQLGREKYPKIPKEVMLKEP